MITVEKTGKTVEEAVNNALRELNVCREDVEVEVIEDNVKGILGFMSKNAKVKVTAKPNPVDYTFRFLSRVLTEMKMNISIDINEQEDHIYVNLQGSNLGYLIGKRGQTLDSLQYIVNLAVNKYTDDYVRVVIDGEGYRKRREDTLVRLSKSLAHKAKKTKRKVVLEPMTPQERRIIHTTLQDESGVYTYSEGEEPYRKVIIDLK